MYNQQEIVLTTLGTFPSRDRSRKWMSSGRRPTWLPAALAWRWWTFPILPRRCVWGLQHHRKRVEGARGGEPRPTSPMVGRVSRVLDVSDPAAIRRLSGVNTSGSALNLGRGLRCCTSPTSRGLVLFDVSDPTALRRLAVVPFPEPVLGVSVSGTLAYVTLGTGVAVVDALNPAAPVVLASLQLSGYPRGIFAAGDRVYVVIASGGSRSWT